MPGRDEWGALRFAARADLAVVEHWEPFKRWSADAPVCAWLGSRTAFGGTEVGVPAPGDPDIGSEQAACVRVLAQLVHG